ncbi:hypothetical protein [Mycoplasmopsis gallinacea]|uniref:Uncharacterized protein n=1 Tax=Mycoplasmopsis gallinacea TaxID=29556 RepID=A0A6H0V1Y9_9BACT|nr:hypothetical protein [Mycoplasmopsis gallinacea]QIW62360.1 hypothetical protein GOQ20_02910 [Mycoplasmopsis gallinacea]
MNKDILMNILIPRKQLKESLEENLNGKPAEFLIVLGDLRSECGSVVVGIAYRNEHLSDLPQDKIFSLYKNDDIIPFKLSIDKLFNIETDYLEEITDNFTEMTGTKLSQTTYSYILYPLKDIMENEKDNLYSIKVVKEKDIENEMTM